MARMPTDRDATHYNMNHKHRGKAIIFNHENFGLQGVSKRIGTNKDSYAMELCLKKLGFDVTLYKDSRYAALMQHVKDAVKFDHTHYDCFVMAVLTHGGDDDQLYAYDRVYNFSQLWEPFAADSCPTLAGKPKLFFAQACRGGKLMAPVVLHGCQTDGSTSYPCYSIPAAADFLFMYSTIPGYVSWRDTDNGSWFIQALCEELTNKAFRCQLEEILTCVKRKVALKATISPHIPKLHEQKQIPSVDSRLTRLLQFTRKSNQFNTGWKQQINLLNFYWSPSIIITPYLIDQWGPRTG